MSPNERRDGDRYRITPQDLEDFRRDGYVHLKGVLSEAEIAPIDDVYQRFVRGEIEVPGKDFCDMSGDYARDPSAFAIINVMLPRRYHPQWQGNLLERRAASIAEQLQGPGLELDYDQLLAKRPERPDAVFGWHQDLAYWPRTPDVRTATIWFALDDSKVENGCMRFVPGSHREPKLRTHGPLHGDREKSHTMVARVDEDRDLIRCAEIARGDCTVHDERVLHGSGGNTSKRWRRAYIIAFRAKETVAFERGLGFTHSHNDAPEVLKHIAELARKG
jgi:phytanoyl-CoA hydroxylase